ncbi:MAG: hypothetical protein N3D72_02340, partial [Candidatus Methanomethyliaceae archaeon]|nr:hypothetical protein [Candidatus Methanomethyliaceae archaeon]
ATYHGSLDWNDVLIYSDGTLNKNSSGIQPVNALGGSECNTIADWSFAYNLISGGTMPTFSSSSGYVRFDCNRISYYNPWGWDSPPVCEAWFYLCFNISEMVRNLTISLYADGLFTYFSGGYIFEQWGEIILYLVQGNNWTLLTQSSKSTSPFLNISMNISPNNFIMIDAIIVAFHTYARGQTYYSIYSNPIWGRIDYLRLSYQRIPNNYSGPSVINLQPGWRAVINSSIYWANYSGIAIIPKNITSWPANLSIAIYPSSEVYMGKFQPGYLYYLYSYKIYSPKIDKIFYQVLNNDMELYRTELTLINYSSSHYIFSFKSFNNGILISDYMPKVLVDGVEQKFIRIAPYTYQIIARRGALLEIYDCFGIRLSALLP